MIIGIGGVSRSGKTTLARQLADEYSRSGHRVQILYQDDFIQPETSIPLIRDRVDWECPESMDFDRFWYAIKSATVLFDDVIAEGILVFYDPMVNQLFDHRIFLEIDHDTFLSRRAGETRWGIEPIWYQEYVWDSYWRFGRTVFDTGYPVEVRHL